MEPILRSLASEVSAGTGRVLRGLIPYNAPTRIFERGKLFTEVIRPGAFARALAPNRDVISTYNHDRNRLLGRTLSGTLRLSDSPDGLRYEVDLPDAAGDVKELLARGDLRGSSFTALALPGGGEKWTRDFRELLALELMEVGPVVSPAYETRAAELRRGASPPAGIPAGRHLVELMDRLAGARG